VVLCLLVAATSAGVGAARPAPVARPAPAALDLHWLIGDENEPDEDEGGDGSERRSARDEDREKWSHRAALGATGLALALAAGATLLIVRWVRRFLAWKRRVAVRAQALTRRLADELDRAWRR
jgi:hypothetical protein